MDPVHRQRIQNNMDRLVSSTRFEPVIQHLSKQNVFTPRVQNRMTSELFLKEMTVEARNRELYNQIQTRGPEAFDKLVDCLDSTGHTELVELLSPCSNRSVVAAPISAPSVNPLHGTYEDNGKRYVVMDHGEGIGFHDREALCDFFQALGYEIKQPEDTIDDKHLSSLLVVNFSVAGSVVKDEDWLHRKLVEPVYAQKPKILISIRYSCEIKRNVTTCTDSGIMCHPYSDMLRVKLFVDELPSCGVSDVVATFIKVCHTTLDWDFQRQLNKVAGELEPKRVVEVDVIGFSSKYFLQKQHSNPPEMR